MASFRLTTETKTVSVAKKGVVKALSYLEKKCLTRGYTSILLKTPDEDVGVFYEKLKEILTALERAEKAPKKRKVFADLAEMKIPRGMHLFPHNKTVAWLPASATFFLLLGIFWGELSFFFTQLNKKVEEKMEDLSALKKYSPEGAQQEFQELAPVKSA